MGAKTKSLHGHQCVLPDPTAKPETDEPGFPDGAKFSCGFCHAVWDLRLPRWVPAPLRVRPCGCTEMQDHRKGCLVGQHFCEVCLAKDNQAHLFDCENRAGKDEAMPCGCALGGPRREDCETHSGAGTKEESCAECGSVLPTHMAMCGTLGGGIGIIDDPIPLSELVHKENCATDGCGHKAIDHSLCYWLVKPQDNFSPIGNCGKCACTNYISPSGRFHSAYGLFPNPPIPIPGDSMPARSDCRDCGARLDTFEHIQRCYMGRFQSGDIIETLTNPKVMVCACGHTASQHLRGNCDICSCLFYESSNPARQVTIKCPDCGSERKTYQHCLCRFLAPPTVPAVGVDMASGKDRAVVGPAPNPAAIPQNDPKGTGREILPLVIKDLKARIEYGTKKYGEPLKAFNARDVLMDAYQEGLDLVVYLKQAIEERNNPQVPEMARGRVVLDGCMVCGNIYAEEGGGCPSCDMAP